MLFGIIIQARRGSKHFLKKILQKIDHRLVIKLMLDHLEKKFKKNNIIVATTIKKQDNKLARLLKKRGNKFFRGSDSNVFARYIKYAKKFEVKNIICLTSDCH